jgi:protein-tyrosine-phosphatase
MQPHSNSHTSNLADGLPITVLFLCSGNVIRSAYAELVFTKMIADEDCLRGRVNVYSGGVTYRNIRIYPEIIEYICQEGVDSHQINKFQPRHIGDHPQLLLGADLILVMTREHLSRIPKEFQEKAHLLYQYVFGKPHEIPDPYFEPPMERAVNMLKIALMGLLQRLKTEICVQ